MDFEEYLKNRIAFLREIREDNKRKLINEDDKMINTWIKEKESIQAKLEECEITLHLYLHPDKPIDIESVGK